jgi:hypothetical protein
VPVVKVATREAQLRRRVRAHLKKLGYSKDENGELVPPRLDKDAYRLIHAPQRAERLEREALFLKSKAGTLIDNFAEGSEVDLDKLRVRLELIEQATWQSDLFRFATLLWSIPVSNGFGRRMRYLVWDDYSRKLIGLFALGDPVFNLGARDRLVGWTSSERAARLANVLDGYVIGAVPPFNLLLGGKLITSLIRTREVVEDFRERYGRTEGLISGMAKNAHLVAVTTTSALGRSSQYNRLRLGGISYLEAVGYTGGYGHFHFPQDLFAEMRAYLRARKDAYAGNNRFGDGPNWRLRAIRQTLTLLGMNSDLLRHGFFREVYFGCLADNAFDILRGLRKKPTYTTLLGAADVARLAVDRWMRPRSARDDRYRFVSRDAILAQIVGNTVASVGLRQNA